jgi:hypothetical protein
MEGQMAMRTLFYRCATGHQAQSIDAWYLILGKDNECWVQHLWSHCEEKERPANGNEIFTATQLMANVNDLTVLTCFRAALENSFGTGH